MSVKVWRFERTVQQTVEELRDVLQTRDRTPVRAGSVRGEWLYRAQLLLEPAGWDALWKLPKDTCQELDVRFPCVVYVTVENIDLESSLEVHVEVTRVQDDSVHLPDRHTVSLEELWPLRHQPNSALHVQNTAQFIDLYRYFYTQIWLPWDLDTDDAEGCWFERCVPPRCALWAAARTPGAQTSPTALQALLDEAHRLHRHITRLEETLPSDAEEDTLENDAERISELVSLHAELQQVRLRWEGLQNPTLQRFTASATPTGDPQNVVIWTGGNIESQIDCLRSLQGWLLANRERATVQCAPSLASALQARPPRASTLLLCPGEHPLTSDMHLGDDYCIAFAPPGSGSATLTCPEPRAAALANTGPLSLHHLSLSCDNASTAIAVRSASLTANDCSLRGPSGDRAQGVVVHPQTSLVMSGCSLSRFFTGIVVHSGSTVELTNCRLEECGVGIQVYFGGRVVLRNCHFRNSTEAAVRYEASGKPSTAYGPVSLLSRYPDIEVVDCEFSDVESKQVCVAIIDDDACTEWEEACEENTNLNMSTTSC